MRPFKTDIGMQLGKVYSSKHQLHNNKRDTRQFLN